MSASGARSLLDLPPELRNQIYELALVDDHGYTRNDVGDIMVTRDDYMQPPLLRTCRQIRSEASEVFQDGSFFSLRIDNLKLAPQPKHWFWKLECSNETDNWEYDGLELWSNLKEWVKLSYDGVAPAPHVESSGDQ